MCNVRASNVIVFVYVVSTLANYLRLSFENITIDGSIFIFHLSNFFQ